MVLRLSQSSVIMMYKYKHYIRRINLLLEKMNFSKKNYTIDILLFFDKGRRSEYLRQDATAETLTIFGQRNTCPECVSSNVIKCGVSAPGELLCFGCVTVWLAFGTGKGLLVYGICVRC